MRVVQKLFTGGSRTVFFLSTVKLLMLTVTPLCAPIFLDIKAEQGSRVFYFGFREREDLSLMRGQIPGSHVVQILLSPQEGGEEKTKTKTKQHVEH